MNREDDDLLESLGRVALVLMGVVVAGAISAGFAIWLWGQL